jgi:hypothetical protein
LFSEPGKSNPIDHMVPPPQPPPPPPTPSRASPPSPLIPPSCRRFLQEFTTFSAKQSPIVRSPPAPLLPVIRSRWFLQKWHDQILPHTLN